MNYWLVKTEPEVYPWSQLVTDRWTFWDGVRNYQARNNLKAMAIGDRVLVYHSNEGLAVVGIAEVIKESYQDPTTDDQAWVAVDIKPVQPLSAPVSLAVMKKEPGLAGMAMFKNGRLSVVPLTENEYHLICKLGGIQ